MQSAHAFVTMLHMEDYVDRTIERIIWEPGSDSWSWFNWKVVSWHYVMQALKKNLWSPFNLMKNSQSILGDQMNVIAQQMIQAALFGLLEKQVDEWHAEVVDEKPKYMKLII